VIVFAGGVCHWQVSLAVQVYPAYQQVRLRQAKVFDKARVPQLENFVVLEQQHCVSLAK
jgi:hypothetical protein